MAALTVRPDLMEKLQEMAQHENRPVDEFLETLLSQYQPPVQSKAPLTLEEALNELRPRLYQRAREYWTQVGDQERLALTDEELNEQFWLFDHEGIPRLKSDQDKVTLPPNTLAKLAEMGRKMNFQAKETDIASRS